MDGGNAAFSDTGFQSLTCSSRPRSGPSCQDAGTFASAKSGSNKIRVVSMEPAVAHLKSALAKLSQACIPARCAIAPIGSAPEA